MHSDSENSYLNLKIYRYSAMEYEAKIPPPSEIASAPQNDKTDAICGFLRHNTQKLAQRRFLESRQQTARSQELQTSTTTP